MISIGIIEDITEIRNSLAEFFTTCDNIVCAFTAGSVEECLNLETAEPLPEIILLDIGLPGISGINGMEFIRNKFPGVEFIMLTVFNDPERIFNALKAGASGYLLKNTPFPKIKEAIEESSRGGASISPQIAKKVIEYFNPVKNREDENSLTEKEKQVIACLVDGMSYKAAASALGNSVDTIRHHIKNIYRKLHVNSKSEVVGKALRGEI